MFAPITTLYKGTSLSVVENSRSLQLNQVVPDLSAENKTDKAAVLLPALKAVKEVRTTRSSSELSVNQPSKPSTKRPRTEKDTLLERSAKKPKDR